MLPLGLPTDITVTSVHDVYPHAVAALGTRGAQALMGVLSSGSYIEPDRNSDPGSSDSYRYPYHYPVFDPILAEAPQDQLRRNATQLAAALTRLAGYPAVKPSNAAATAAYAVLDSSRSSGGCDAQLNLLLLVAADPVTSPQILANEYNRSATACPNEPTPGWIVGQAQMRKFGLEIRSRPNQTDTQTRATLAAAVTTFHDLSKHFPQDTSVVTGLGDAYLRAGLRLLYSDPFTARDKLRLAVRQYNRAAELGAVRDADLGRARALIALGDPERAAKLAEGAAADSPRPGAALEVALAAEEAAHHFDAAKEVGRRLEHAGPDSYPPAVAFFPRPTDMDGGMSFDATLPLSTGADTVAPLQTMLVVRGGAGGTVEDFSFIPQYRDVYFVTDIPMYCPSVAWRRDAIVGGQAALVLTGWPDSFTGSRPDWRQRCNEGVSTLHSTAELAAHHSITNDADVTKDDITDNWQNLLRWAGDLVGARKVITQWEAEAGDNNATPALRLAEVAFLQGSYDESAALFGVAARRSQFIDYQDELSVLQAQLGRGGALLKAGRDVEAVAVLRPLEQDGMRGSAFEASRLNSDAAAQFAAVSYHAAVQLGDHASANGDMQSAVDHYNLAAALTTKLELDDYGFRPEVVYNNLALAYLAIGETQLAEDSEAKALKVDPMDPVFLMSAGFIADRAGNTASAAGYNRRALQSDPGAFAAANDLGVQLARTHDYDGAAVALRQAIGIAPGYALAWFNLGVLEGLRGPTHLIRSQGAFAKAFTLDPTLKDRRRELTIDGSVYRTALDLSKPLPPRWSLAQTQKAATATTASLLTVALLAVGLARTSRPQGSQLAKQWLEPIAEHLNKIQGPKWLQHSAWAVAATVLAFLLTSLRRPTSTTEVVAYCLGLGAMIGAAVYVRAAVAALAKAALAQSAWLPGMAFGLVTGAIGSPWAPLPVTTSDTQSNRLHLAAPLTLAALSLVLFVEAAWLDAPLTRAFAVAALIMTGSTLLPIKPLDGARVTKGGAVAAGGVVGGAVLLILGVV